VLQLIAIIHFDRMLSPSAKRVKTLFAVTNESFQT